MMDQETERILFIISSSLTLIYNLEAIIKIVALQSKYFYDSWNRFDFLVVLVSDISFLLEVVFTSGIANETMLNVMRVFKAMRIMRMFSLMRRNKQMKVLVDSLVTILPSIVNVVSLIMLMFFVFTVIGMNVFSNVV